MPSDQIAGVRRVQWASHERWLREHLQPGEHIGVLTPTGGGKSYLTVEGLLRLPVIDHSRVLMVDDKGNDRTTRGWGTPITSYPPGWDSRRREDDQAPHWRLIVPEWTWSSTGTHTRGVDHARQVVGDALDRFYAEAEDPADEGAPDDAQASVAVIDETFALTGSKPPSLNLAPLLVKYWRKGRYRALTLIALSQEPAHLPGEYYSQPTHLYLGKQFDGRRTDRLKEIGGDTDRIRAVVPKLGKHEFLFVGNKGEFLSVVQVGR